LLSYVRLRLRAEALGVSQVDLAGGSLHLRFSPATPVEPAAAAELLRARPGAGLTPHGLRLPVPPDTTPTAELDTLFDALAEAARSARAL
jgi:hypothetical protein